MPGASRRYVVTVFGSISDSRYIAERKDISVMGNNNLGTYFRSVAASTSAALKLSSNGAADDTVACAKEHHITFIALAKSLLLYGASSGIVAGAVNNPIEGLIQACHQRFGIFGDEISEPFCLDQQPQPLNGI